MKNIYLESNIENLIRSPAVILEGNNVIYKFKKIDNNKISDLKSFFDEFNKVLNPPKKFVSFDNFESQMKNVNWISDNVVVSYSDSARFKAMDSENYEKSRYICKQIQKQYDLSKGKNWVKTRSFVFNYNGSHFKQSAMLGAGAGALAGATFVGMMSM